MTTLVHGATVGVLGGGQLGRMLALAGTRLGLNFRFFDPSPYAPAGTLGELIADPLEDSHAISRFTEGLAAATFEFESVPVRTAERVAARVRFRPSPEGLRIAQDRLLEKQHFQKLDIPTPTFAPLDESHSPASALEAVGAPALLKSRRGGYDGKGQARVDSVESLERAWEVIGRVPAILESLVPFDREVSALLVRSDSGETAMYPISENEHREGILRVSRPVVGDPLAGQAESHVVRLAESLDFVGVLALEFFEHEGRLLANEFAPRVHNSGHWTIDAAATSQFENHLRALLDLPLGPTTLERPSAMVNLIGHVPPLEELLSLEGVRVHLYGKSPRQGRKVGHLTVVGDDAEQVDQRLDSIRRYARD